MYAFFIDNLQVKSSIQQEKIKLLSSLRSFKDIKRTYYFLYCYKYKIHAIQRTCFIKYSLIAELPGNKETEEPAAGNIWPMKRLA